jgi:putative flippase GtrA
MTSELLESTATGTRSESRADDPVVPVAVDVVVPVYNEQDDIDASIRRLHHYLRTSFPFTFRVTIADNASTDGTWATAQGLADELPGVLCVHLPDKGRGRALRHVWSGSDSAVLAYMDVDLSTDLAALLPLVAPLLSGHSDLAIGSRLSRDARVLRGPKRELISRGYNLVLYLTLGTRFSDAQCGFKAIRADAARALLPLVRDDAWFFDTELLVLAERSGLRIHEVPVDWVDDPDSRVDIVRTAIDDLKGVARLGRGLAAGSIPLDHVRASRSHPFAAGPPATAAQVLRFAVVGGLSTLVYLLLYVGLRTGVSAPAANAAALLTTAVGNTWANRRFTFAIRGRSDAGRHQAQGLLVFGLALALTTGSLAALHLADPQPTRLVEVLVLVLANLAATVLRFVLLRSWVFRRTSGRAAHHNAVEPTADVPSVPDLRSAV